MPIPKKLFYLFIVTILLLSFFFIQKKRGFQYVHRMYWDYNFFDDLSVTENSINGMIDIALPLHGLTNEQILNYLIENEPGLFSQRLIMGLNNTHSLDYILYRLFDKKLNIGLDDKAVLMIEELTKKLEYGVGGIHLSGTAIASFHDVQGLNSFLSQLKEICKTERYIKFLDAEIRLTIKPNIYFDYNMSGSGLNYKNITNYNNVETKDLDSNIFYIDVDGLFCPRIDYSKNIDKNKNEILNKSVSLSSLGTILFPKHFGFRGDFISSNIIDPHAGIVVVDTPIENFLKEDISIYDLIINNTDNIGIMVGNHILTCLDKNKPASSSQKVVDFINRRYSNKLITITDSINMPSFKLLYDQNGLYDYVKTDLILMTDLYGYNVNSILKKGNDKRLQSLKKIMILKLLNGNITLKVVHK
jgi:hypothetical protein